MHTANPLHPKPGTIIGGKYRVERTIGEGGMGVVVLAVHDELKSRVALKILHPTAVHDGQSVARFRREAQIASALRSEHAAKVSDFGTDAVSGAPYLVMEYLEGRDLATALEAARQRGEWLGVEQVCDYLLQACDAIAEAHAAGIVHRDVKPPNLFLTHRRDGSPCVKVLDFGISKQLDPGNAAMTSTRQTMGSPLYMSPEQMRSSKRVTPSTDIWALGVVLYELLTGRVPFHGEEFGEIFLQILNETPPPPRSLRPDIPPGLEALILRCLSKDPVQRPASAAELAASLAPFASPAMRSYASSIAAVARSSQPAFADAPSSPGSGPVSLPGASPSLGALPFPGASSSPDAAPPAGAQTFSPVQSAAAPEPAPRARLWAGIAAAALGASALGGVLLARSGGASETAASQPPAASSVVAAPPSAEVPSASATAEPPPAALSAPAVASAKAPPGPKKPAAPLKPPPSTKTKPSIY